MVLKSQTRVHRPVDLARAHGLSAQAVRNYEKAGVIPAAARTASGYRVYTDDHAGALAAYLGLLPGFGYRVTGVIMQAVLRGDLESALAAVSTAHVQLQRDRETVARVASAAHALTVDGERSGTSFSVGTLARRLDITPATLRKWERAKILAPARSRGARIYSPDDIRDAELAHLLRRGGYRLDHIATVIEQVRAADGPGPLAESIEQWRERITARGRAMLIGAARLSDYLEKRVAPPGREPGGATDSGAQRGKSR